MKYLVTFNGELKNYTSAPYTYIDLELDQQDALDWIRQQVHSELNIDPQIIYNGLTVATIHSPINKKNYGQIPCKNCGQMFTKYNQSQKYCCFHCAEQGRKQNQKERQDKYLAKEQNRTKHLIRLKTHYRMRAEQPTVCEQCGKVGKLHFHHFMYSDEYITIGKWLCPKCHSKQHKGQMND